MNWDAIGSLGAIVGAVAVAITLIYLSMQVREARIATEAQIYQARADAASRAIAEFPVVHKYLAAKRTMKVADAIATLDEDECYQLRGHIADLMIRMDNSYFQFRRGLLDEDQLEVILHAVRGRREERRILGVQVETMMLSRAFKDLVSEVDSEADYEPYGDFVPKASAKPG